MLIQRNGKKIFPFFFVFLFFMINEFQLIKRATSLSVFQNLPFFLCFSYYNNESRPLQFSYFEKYSNIYNSIGFQDFSPVLI